LKEINKALEVKMGKNTNPGRGQPSGKHMHKRRFFETL
jgi:hypothetical protein